MSYHSQICAQVDTTENNAINSHVQYTSALQPCIFLTGTPWLLDGNLQHSNAPYTTTAKVRTLHEETEVLSTACISGTFSIQPNNEQSAQGQCPV